MRPFPSLHAERVHAAIAKDDPAAFRAAWERVHAPARPRILARMPNWIAAGMAFAVASAVVRDPPAPAPSGWSPDRNAIQPWGEGDFEHQSAIPRENWERALWACTRTTAPASWIRGWAALSTQRPTPSAWARGYAAALLLAEWDDDVASAWRALRPPITTEDLKTIWIDQEKTASPGEAGSWETIPLAAVSAMWEAEGIAPPLSRVIAAVWVNTTPPPDALAACRQEDLVDAMEDAWHRNRHTAGPAILAALPSPLRDAWIAAKQASPRAAATESFSEEFARLLAWSTAWCPAAGQGPQGPTPKKQAAIAAGSAIQAACDACQEIATRRTLPGVTEGQALTLALQHHAAHPIVTDATRKNIQNANAYGIIQGLVMAPHWVRRAACDLLPINMLLNGTKASDRQGILVTTALARDLTPEWAADLFQRCSRSQGGVASEWHRRRQLITATLHHGTDAALQSVLAVGAPGEGRQHKNTWVRDNWMNAVDAAWINAGVVDADGRHDPDPAGLARVSRVWRAAIARPSPHRATILAALEDGTIPLAPSRWWRCHARWWRAHHPHPRMARWDWPDVCAMVEHAPEVVAACRDGWDPAATPDWHTHPGTTNALATIAPDPDTAARILRWCITTTRRHGVWLASHPVANVPPRSATERWGWLRTASLRAALAALPDTAILDALTATLRYAPRIPRLDNGRLRQPLSPIEAATPTFLNMTMSLCRRTGAAPSAWNQKPIETTLPMLLWDRLAPETTRQFENSFEWRIGGGTQSPIAHHAHHLDTLWSAWDEVLAASPWDIPDVLRDHPRLPAAAAAKQALDRQRRAPRQRHP